MSDAEVGVRETMVRAIVRDRRQITLPAEVMKELGLKVGDAVEIEVEERTARITPSKEVALDALKELRRIFAESGISEKEFQADLRRIRKEMNKEQYGIDEA
jgi:AbrB family looped-hinge helix DNA binding protein